VPTAFAPWRWCTNCNLDKALTEIERMEAASLKVVDNLEHIAASGETDSSALCVHEDGSAHA
jgi:hypothetical protein